jgi:hypothetical protein
MTGAEGDFQFSIFAGCDLFREIGPFTKGSVLGAVLNDAFVLFGGFDQFAAFE